MGIRDWFSRPRAVLARDGAVDLSEFERAGGDVSPSNLVTLAAYALGVHALTPADQVPVQILDAMAWDPAVYLGERAATAPLLDPESYFVRHGDPDRRREVEAWLWPILPDLVRSIARALAYGASVYVLDWRIAPLELEGGERLADRAHFAAVHELSLAEARLETAQDRVVAIHAGDRRYEIGPGGRGFVAWWDRQFGRWIGNGSRRRAFQAWFEKANVRLWRGRYLERSVDPPRIGYAPKGTVTIGGKEVLATRLLSAALMSLKNGSAATLPSERVDGQQVWDVRPLDLPDRSTVWETALNRCDAEMLIASLVPPTLVGVEDATFASARISAELFIQFVEAQLRWVAGELSRVVAVVDHLVHGDDAAPVEVASQGLPRAKQKLLLEVLRLVHDTRRVLEDGREYTFGELVSGELLDLLGVPRRAPEDVATAAAVPSPAGPPGRPPDATSAREDRRDAEREPDGMGPV